MSLLNEETVVVATTAMPRSELLDRTYASFQEKMPWLNFKKMRLCINIDPFPRAENEEERERTLAVAKRRFGEVSASLPDQPSFPLAVKSVYARASAMTDKFILAIEDDWELLREIKRESIEPFFSDLMIQQVAFRAWDVSTPRFVLSPSFLRSSFCRSAADKLIPNVNPEQRIRHVNLSPASSFVYWPSDPKEIMLKDLGRAWMEKTSYARGDDDFTAWTPLRNPLSRWRYKLSDQNKLIDP